MEAISTALTNATTVLTSAITFVTGNPVLMIPVGLGLLGGASKFIKRWL